MKKMKIGLVASSGGHLTQLTKVVSRWEGHSAFWVTTTRVVGGVLGETGRVYVVGECNREHPVRVMRVLCRCVGIVWRERPDVVISSGAAVGCLMCYLAKLTGAKVIWMDSITNVERLSLSGRLVRPIANLFLVQWPALAERYSGVEYAGAVI
jgi:hypothetical protein